MNVNELNGTYRGRAVDGGLGKAGNGNEQVAISFELLGDGPEKGLHVTWYGSFSEKAEEITFKALRACGFTGIDLTVIDNFATSGLNANEVELVIEQEEYNGKTQTKVKWVNATRGLALKTRLEPAEASSFAARMKAKLLAFDQANGAPKNNGAPARTPPGGGGAVVDPGKIPF
jgi:hypothetical protein